MADDQRDVIDFLSRPSSYGTAVDRVDVIETHASLVFLAGEHAYKLKRAVKYPYLDFSTAALRREACEAELALNRRTAPELYLEVRALTRTAQGGVGFATDGAALDWVVVMRRFDQAMLFDALGSGRPLDRVVDDRIGRSNCRFPSGGRTVSRSGRRCGAGRRSRDQPRLPDGGA